MSDAAEQARDRWPEDLYPVDTLGGMRRDIMVRAHGLTEELRAKTKGAAAECLAGQVAEGFLAELGDMEAQIDQLQEEGLRVAFRSMMGYELT